MQTKSKVDDARESTVVTQSGEVIEESSLSLSTSMNHKELHRRADSLHLLNAEETNYTKEDPC